MIKIWSFMFLCLNTLPSCYGVNSKNELINTIFRDYNKEVTPSLYNEPIDLHLGIALRAFKNINQMEGTVSANIWLRYKWIDDRLSWSMNNHNFTFISINTNPELDYSIWIPDIYLYNTAENPLSELDYSRAIVKNTGEVIWSRPGIITSTCSFDLTHFPYDRQYCYMKFGSWSHDGKQLNLSIYNEGFDISNYIKHEEWELSKYYVEKNVEYYNCCPEPYPDIKFHYVITRYSGYYDLNIVLPTFATASLVLLTLLVPWSSGERISFATTVMLSIIVFLLILSDNLPKSDQKPLLSRMIIGLTLFSFFGVFFTILISALSDYNEKFDKNENTTTNKIIIWLHRNLKKIQCCEKEINNEDNDIEVYNIQSIQTEIENNTEIETEFNNTIQNLKINYNNQIDNNNNNNLINDGIINNRTESYYNSLKKKNLIENNDLNNNDLNNNDLNNNDLNNNDLNNNESQNEIIKEECLKMINYFEHIYMIMFFIAFITYCIVMFSLIPNY